jgi:hypothetical protein
MNNIHPTMQQAIAPWAPPPQPPVSEPERRAVDAAMHADKLRDGYGQRNYIAAMLDQLMRTP